MRGNGSVKRRWLSPLDRTWGLFGSRSGGGYLAAERVVLLVEFLLCLAASGNTGGPPSKPLLLSFAGFAITMMLTLIQLKVQFPSTDEEVAPR
jgi:hypothetical protein